MAQVRPLQVVTALRRLGYTDHPGVGDHITCAKLLQHPSGPVTITTGLDTKHCGPSEVARVQRQTKLKGDMWTRALAKKLPMDEYDQFLCDIPIVELVPKYWSGLVGQTQGAGVPVKKKASKKRSPKRR